ncbi:MAG: molybdopterin cofactor-binding domain-containing protein [Candidatus Neomarinimicrobiota bacterium]|nr:molybdopterin cofactor-binding domain-containing protein [Candidatus Neomarinimicrobiota bacterium]
MSTTVSRRDFLKVTSSAGTGLMMGVYLPGKPRFKSASVDSFEPNVWIKISPDNKVTITLAKSEMGQGVKTALPMIVADELDAEWKNVEVVQADAHPDKYGGMMTVGSRSVRGGAWMRLREAGATVRGMLISAAAKQWGVDPSSCRTENSSVYHDSSHRFLSYGELTAAAAELKVPKHPKLKDPSQFRYIGKSIPQIDTPDKVSGKTVFGQDVRLSGMLYATVVHPPVFGASVKSFDDREAIKVAGVKKVFQVSLGIAVVAKSTWAAFKGADALEVEWDNDDFLMDSVAISNSFRKLAKKNGAVARDDGNAVKAMTKAHERLEAVYEVPYLAHATMEPMNCTARVRPGHCELWVPTQNPQGSQRMAAQLTGLSKDQVTVHVTQLGGGFGRRSRTDFIQDAVETAMRLDVPVQVVWTREEDMQHDYYRPATYNLLEAGINRSGEPVAWNHRVVAPPIGWRGGPNSVDRSSVDGASNLPYQIPNILVDYCRSDIPVPVGHWRSVGPSQNTFISESFIDEIAYAAGEDPFEYRRKLLKSQPRLRKVLEIAAEKSGWGEELPEGRARGIALVENKGSICAEVAEVSIQGSQVIVKLVTCTFY